MSDGDQRQLSAEQEEKLRSTFLQFTHDGREVLDREEFMKMVESNGNLSGESIYHKFEHAEDGTQKNCFYGLICSPIRLKPVE